ncbi:MAG: FtsQ-type POTRA domain-containing protein [Anaerolineales bacterium]|nr:FtsQ-type POTRA domain-containing protein [Anaerolineales bacterium]
MSNKREITRAEQVRARRALHSAKEMQQTAQRAVKPIAPVVSRASAPHPQARPVNLKKMRQFNVSLASLPSITLRKPAIHLPHFSKPKLNWRTASAVLALLLAITLYLTWTLPYFYVPQAAVFGNNRLTRDEINAALGVQGQSIFWLQPKELETRLRLNYPELASAKVDVYLPNYVYVTVTERQPVILLQQGEAFAWVDASGVAFRPRGASGVLIPVLASSTPPAGIADLSDPFSPPPYMQKELVDAILALTPSVPAGSILTFDSTDGLSWKDARGWKAVFGISAQDMPLKVRVYQALVDSLLSRNKIPEYINVAFPDAPYYRMAQPVDPDTATTETTETIDESEQ